MNSSNRESSMKILLLLTSILLRDEATHGVMASMSAFLACHKC